MDYLDPERVEESAAGLDAMAEDVRVIPPGYRSIARRAAQHMRAQATLIADARRALGLPP